VPKAGTFDLNLTEAVCRLRCSRVTVEWSRRHSSIHDLRRIPQTEVSLT
jgi:hypothetical protein